MPAEERASVPHLGEGGAWKSPSRGRLACPPPLFHRRCLLFFFFRTPTILTFELLFGHLSHGQSHEHETTSAPASTASTTTPGPITAASSRRRSPCAESATRALFAWPNNGECRPAREHCNQQIGCCSPVRCMLYVLLQVYCSTYCCIAVLLYWVGSWVHGGWWVGGGRRLARSPRWPSIVKK